MQGSEIPFSVGSCSLLKYDQSANECSIRRTLEDIIFLYLTMLESDIIVSRSPEILISFHSSVMRSWKCFGTWFVENAELLISFAKANCKSWIVGPYELAPTTDKKHLHFFMSFKQK